MNTTLESAFHFLTSFSRLTISGIHADPPFWLMTAAALLAAATLVHLISRPRHTLALLARLLAHTLYRIDANALATVPRQGGALLIANHVSFVDALLIAGLSPRPVRFVMDARIHGHWLLGPLFRVMGTIPILPSRVCRRVLARAHENIAEALENGELVCIFPEGGITRDGRLAPFRPGVERIVRRTPVPVVPIALCGLWGSIFSRADRRLRRKGLRRSLRIISAKPLPPEAISAKHLQREVARLLDRGQGQAK